MTESEAAYEPFNACGVQDGDRGFRCDLSPGHAGMHAAWADKGTRWAWPAERKPGDPVAWVLGNALQAKVTVPLSLLYRIDSIVSLVGYRGCDDEARTELRTLSAELRALTDAFEGRSR